MWHLVEDDVSVTPSGDDVVFSENDTWITCMQRLKISRVYFYKRYIDIDRGYRLSSTSERCPLMFQGDAY